VSGLKPSIFLLHPHGQTQEQYSSSFKKNTPREKKKEQKKINSLSDSFMNIFDEDKFAACPFLTAVRKNACF